MEISLGLAFALSGFLLIPIIAGVVCRMLPELHSSGLMPDPGFPLYLPSYLASLLYGLITLVWYQRTRKAR